MGKAKLRKGKDERGTALDRDSTEEDPDPLSPPLHQLSEGCGAIVDSGGRATKRGCDYIKKRKKGIRYTLFVSKEEWEAWRVKLGKFFAYHENLSF